MLLFIILNKNQNNGPKVKKKKCTQKKDEFEGPLFIVERKESPIFKFIIMNRLHTDNFCQDLQQIDLQVESPYVLFKNKENKEIKGLWFYNYVETIEFVQTIEE
jgi:hypothetical protein